MNIDEAIEILQHRLDTSFLPVDEDFRQSVKLGIEALKRVKWAKELPGFHDYKPLPGETE